MGNTIFIPNVNVSGNKNNPEPVSFSCEMNEIAYQMSLILVNSDWQERKELICDILLVKAAQHKAERMANENFFSHVTPDGIHPNRNVKNFGYPLPYNSQGNNIESIAAGYRELQEVFQKWLNSSHHHDHITGNTDFFKSHTRFGIGYAEKQGSKYFHYYCLVTAPIV